MNDVEHAEPLAGRLSQRNKQARAARADTLTFRLVAAAWFLYLLAPAKLIEYYLPAARVLTWVNELLLWICAIRWLRASLRKRSYPAYTFIFGLMILGTVVAFVIGNWGFARATLRLMYQYYLLGLITITICSTPDRARTILRIYFAYFLWYGIWGLISLKVSPLSQYQDPGTRMIVFWHPEFDNRDAFGPLMVAGLAYSIYYFLAHGRPRSIGLILSSIVSIVLCALGFVTSFGRGAFLGFIAVAVSMWLRSRQKVAALLAATALSVAFVLLAPTLTARYLESMHTITEQGIEQGTGEDRANIWSIAWREFLRSPIVGVGLNNFGIATQRVIAPDEYVGDFYTRERLWGRSVHSTPLTIISEFGILGAVAACVLVIDFFRTNRRIRERAAAASGRAAGPRDFPAEYLAAIALGLNAVFLAFCVSGLFYEIIYTSLYWVVLILNRMLYFASEECTETSPQPAAEAAMPVGEAPT